MPPTMEGSEEYQGRRENQAAVIKAIGSGAGLRSSIHTDDATMHDGASMGLTRAAPIMTSVKENSG